MMIPFPSNIHVPRVYVDVAVTHPCASSHVERAAKQDMITAGTKSQQKHNKYHRIGTNIVALVMETYGGMTDGNAAAATATRSTTKHSTITTSIHTSSTSTSTARYDMSDDMIHITYVDLFIADSDSCFFFG